MMPHTQPLTIRTVDTDYLTDLHTAANQLIQAGYSIIPLNGDTAQNDLAKVPPISWRRYQHEIAQFTDTREWFLNKGYGGLAVVCGHDGLMVAEADTTEWNARFEAALPDLLNTRTIRSAGRKLPHRYYKMPDGFPLHFRGQAGEAELRGAGQFVVTFPTRIGDSSYDLIRGGDPLQLNAEQAARLFAFYDDNFGKPYEDAHEFETIATGDSNHLTAVFTKQVTKLQSRNKAAFVALGWARDNGWSKAAARLALRATFADCPPVGTHTRETSAARGKEFDATLTSVYSRQPQKRHAVGIPTLLREQLLQHELIGLARVLDCLVMSGWVAGQSFTEADAVKQCGQHHISRDTVRNALKTTIQGMLNTLVTPSAAALTLAAFSPSEIQNLDVLGVPSNNETIVFNAKDNRHSQDIQKRGKSVRVFYMPDAIELCAMFGIDRLFSDALPFAALATVGDYRTAITKALIQRKPQQYKQQLLAKRVGVKPRRMRYILKRDKSIKSTPCYRETIVTADNLKSLISDNRADMGGYCLDIEGKRLPPVPHIAQQYLANGYTVKLIKREANHYQVEAATITRDTPTTESAALAKAAGAENDYIPQSTVTEQETVITADPLLIELTALGGILVPIAAGETRRRPPEQKLGGV